MIDSLEKEVQALTLKLGVYEHLLLRSGYTEASLQKAIEWNKDV